MKTVTRRRILCRTAFLCLCLMLSFSLRPLFSLARESREAPPVILVTLEPGKTDTAIDLFLNSYDGTVLSEQNVIAPGTENSVCVRFTEPHTDFSSK